MNDPRLAEQTRLSYWFPKIQAAGLPVPKTEVIELPDDVYDAFFKHMCHGDNEDRFGLDRLRGEIVSASRKIGVPLFLRTDHTSAKHDWRESCHVTSIEALDSHIAAIWECSEMADFFGLPTKVWVVREMLKTTPLFHAFRGMPITREFRMFVRDGRIEHSQPYWPANAIRRPDHPDWLAKLQKSHEATPNEVGELIDLAVRANAAVPGYWSVDLLETADRGWVLTDMAEGDKSFKWDNGDPAMNAPYEPDTSL